MKNYTVSPTISHFGKFQVARCLQAGSHCFADFDFRFTAQVRRGSHVLEHWGGMEARRQRLIHVFGDVGP